MKGEASLDPVLKDVVGMKKRNVMAVEEVKVRLDDEDRHHQPT